MKHTVNPCREGMLIKKGTVIDKQFRVGRETESPTTDNSNWKTETVILVFFVFFFFRTPGRSGEQLPQVPPKGKLLSLL